MASASSIAKLHRNQPPQLRSLIAQPAEVKQADVAAPSLIGLYTRSLMAPVRRRWIQGRDRWAPHDDHHAISVWPPDRARDFAVLAMQDRLRTLARHAGRDDHPQHAEVQIQL